MISFTLWERLVEDPHLSDEVLLQRISERDADALEELYNRHAQVVFSLSVRIVRDSALADEILQETFWQVWRKAEAYRGAGAAAAWLYRIARNKSLDQLRRKSARPQPVLSASEAEDEVMWASLASGGAEVETVAERNWDLQHVREALAGIPAEQRLCLELAYFEGMSQSQIASFTDTPLGTTKTRIRSGLQKLERILRTAGYGTV